MSTDDSPLSVEVTSTIRLFPDPALEHQDAITIPLSIVDNTVSYYARCAAVWFYDPPSSPDQAILVSHLQTALQKTLNSYRHFCGHLFYAVVQPNEGHTKRYRRVQVTYNAPTDLGVQFVVAKSSKTLADFIPSASARETSFRVWDAAAMPSSELLPTTSLALSFQDNADAPNFLIQVTTFACGSTAIGLALAHGLSDAQTMCTFANDWAATSRALHQGTALPSFSPVFDPQLLDAAAFGDIDADSPDPKIVEEVQKMPFHRYDWYKEVPGQPWPAPIPKDLDPNATFTPSTPIPWHEWATNDSVSGRILHFTPSQVQQIYDIANASHCGPKISKHDVLLAHIWNLVNSARQHSPSTQTYIDISLGLRPRLSLPKNFIGSPIVNLAIPHATLSGPTPISTLASTVRSYINMFDRDAIGKFLHDAAFEVSPQRLWRAFLGSRHILQTSWIQSGFQDVDFVGVEKGGPELRFVQPEMGGDGLLLLMEALGNEKGGHWTANGVDVVLYLEDKSMERLLADPKLWGDGIA